MCPFPFRWQCFSTKPPMQTCRSSCWNSSAGSRAVMKMKKSRKCFSHITEHISADYSVSFSHLDVSQRSQAELLKMEWHFPVKEKTVHEKEPLNLGAEILPVFGLFAVTTTQCEEDCSVKAALFSCSRTVVFLLINVAKGRLSYAHHRYCTSAPAPKSSCLLLKSLKRDISEGKGKTFFGKFK